MEFLTGKSNMALVRSHWGHECGLLWDAYSLPTQNPNGTLEGLEFEMTTFMEPGLNDYYDTGIPVGKVDEFETDYYKWQVGGQELPADKSLIMWCGELYQFYRHISLNSGAKVTFLPFPDGIEALMDLMLREEAWMTVMEMFLSGFKYIPSSGVGSYLTHMDYGHVIMLNRYHRKEFLFLQSFSPGVWIGILLAIMGLALVLSFIASHLQPRSRRVRRSVQCNAIVLFLDLFGVMLNQTIKIPINAILAGLIGMWLLIATVLGNCMQGSMRDLMSDATEVIVAHGWHDLFYNPDLYDMMVVTMQILPTWLAWQNSTDPDIREGVDSKMSRGLFTLLEIDLTTINLKDVFSEIGVLLIKGFQHFAFVIFAISFNMFVWLIAIFQIFVEAFFTYEILRMSGQDHDEKAVQDNGQLGVDFFAELFRTMYSEIHISAPRDQEPFFLLKTHKGPDRFWDYIHQLSFQFRDFGFVYRLNDMSEVKMAERFFPHRLPTHKEPHEGQTFAPIGLESDMFGPFVVFGAALAVCVFCLLAELVYGVILSKKQKSDRQPVPVEKGPRRIALKIPDQLIERNSNRQIHLKSLSFTVMTVYSSQQLVHSQAGPRLRNFTR